MKRLLTWVAGVVLVAAMGPPAVSSVASKTAVAMFPVNEAT